ncbi:zinc-ribbon domain-containing protein [Stigmatella sp. ncwal1]|uniref:Zinc-ribbon domain-containing protein n=1 Tax=Stigmatella ashevillensis TaxID=2995309 RepID=A0ABT5D1S6_9BACT|nr:zinc-ribbon domain-containing protein [Stigmatella ashevillena]MDC0707045.1 zinc-ribbon domain-containing protein [Stigmatella ashevillena]
MQIACPQCSMRYDLDPRLLPPVGASVQCTRCSFVFTATPAGQTLLPGQKASPPGPKAPGGNRPPAVNETLLFGGSPAKAAPKAGAGSQEDVTPVYGTAAIQAVPEEGERTPAFGTALPPASAASLGKTQLFGAPPPRPTVSTTQVFGAASIAQAAKAPPPSTTQVFGAVSIAQAAQAPSPSTTQAFGAASIPQASQATPPSTTQVFGAASIAQAAQAPPPSTTQAFGAAQLRSAEGEGGKVLPPGLREKKPSPEVPWSMPEVGGESRPSLPSLPAEPASPWGGSPPAARRATALELPPELLLPNSPSGPRSPEESVPGGGGRERLLIALAAAVVLGLTAWLTYPAWRNRASELPSEAVSTKDEAVLLLRRDDPASLSQAIERLRKLVGTYPKYTEAQAELVVALALRLDDTKAELEWLASEEARLRQEISALEKEKSLGEWNSRANARKDELDGVWKQRQPLEAIAAELTQQLEEASAVIRKAPETEPASDVLARLKAQAIQGGVMGSPTGLGMAERFRKVENPAHWSAVAFAEHGLHTRVPPDALMKLSEELTQVRSRDSTFLRVYVLEARMSLRLGDPSAARALLDAVVTLNPNHTLARKLRQWAVSAQEATAPSP